MNTIDSVKRPLSKIDDKKLAKIIWTDIHIPPSLCEQSVHTLIYMLLGNLSRWKISQKQHAKVLVVVDALKYGWAMLCQPESIRSVTLPQNLDRRWKVVVLRSIAVGGNIGRLQLKMKPV